MNILIIIGFPKQMERTDFSDDEFSKNSFTSLLNEKKCLKKGTVQVRER